MDPSGYERRTVKVSLAELLRCFEHPISEEEAWAICFQCCRKIDQLIQGLCPSLCSVFIKDSGSIFIHADGTTSFKVYHKSGKSIDTCRCQGCISSLVSCLQLLEYLGVVIYEALDWGIDSQMERELSDPLEKLLCLMLKLDDKATKPPVTLQSVIKACEEHLSRPSEATSHYEMTCRSLFTEYMELQKLVTVIQASKEVCLGLPISCYSFYLHTLTKSESNLLIALEMEHPDEPTTDLALAGFSKASLWHDVICELQTGVRLRKATERSQHCMSPKERVCSPYELLLDDIQHKRYALRKVSDWSQQSTLETSTPFLSIVLSPLVSLLCPMALYVAMVCLQMLKVKLKQCVPQEPSWHEQLMAEVKQPPKLWTVVQEKRSRPRGTCY
ncbi:SPIR1 protein, partial [Cinclus mexicanus]|nr:SPIR1 protein [Cinclus mexicanus]